MRKRNSDREHVMEILKNHDLRATESRIDILTILLESDSPMTIQDIKIKVGSLVDLVTIYRILEKLIKIRIVNRIHLKNNAAYFELNDAADDHHHLVCTKCGKIKDFTGCNFHNTAQKVLATNSDFSEISGHSFEFFGVCKDCALKV